MSKQFFYAKFVFIMYEQYQYNKELTSDEKSVMVFVIIFLIIVIFLFFRNFWNFIQKRRYRSKYNNLCSEHEKLKLNNYSLEKRKIDLYNKNVELVKVNKKLKVTHVKFENSYKEKEKELEEELEKFNTERFFYQDKLNHREVQASNTRLGAHFLKNVLFKLQEVYKEQTLNEFNLFGNSVIIEKKKKKELLPIDILTKINTLLDYNVSTLNDRKVKLNQEIKQIKLFLEIIKFLKPNVNITTNFKDNYKIEVTPTLFFPFLENALKHGNLNREDSILNIELIILKKSLSYRITNTSFKVSDSKNKQGFGLESLKNALKVYYKSHEIDLDYHENKNEFVSELNIEL